MAWHLGNASLMHPGMFKALQPYLNPESRQNNGPDHLTIAQTSAILHTFGVHVHIKPMLHFREKGFKRQIAETVRSIRPIFCKPT